jgi:hypothetical protein
MAVIGRSSLIRARLVTALVGLLSAQAEAQQRSGPIALRPAYELSLF